MKQSVKMIVGNWKMNGLTVHLAEARAVLHALATDPCPHRIALCPPATLIAQMAGLARGSALRIGGQDCHEQAAGACTGSLSAAMIADAGASLVILGHSERRQACGETDGVVAAKVVAALAVGLEPIVCVGETLAQRQDGGALVVVAEQLARSLPDSLDGRLFAIAYEPVWAIGTGLTPTPGQIAEVHQAVRTALSARFGEIGAVSPVLYGGSVNPANAREILATPNVDGALVGGASLRATDFLAIVRAAGPASVAADA